MARIRTLSSVITLFAGLVCNLLLPQEGMAVGTFISAPNRVDMVHDPIRDVLYITSGSQVLRYQVGSRAFLSPIQLSGTLCGIDLSPDSTTLVVADRLRSDTNVWVHVIDLATMTSRRAFFSRDYYEGGTFAVAFGNDGAALISSTFEGSGWVPLRRYDPQTGDVREVASVRQNSMVTSSGDGSSIAVAESNSSGGPVNRYDVAFQSIMLTGGTGWFNYEVGVNKDGSQFAVPTYGGCFIYDGNMTLATTLGTYAGGQPIGVAYHPSADVVFFAWATTREIRAYNAVSFQQLAAYDFEQVFRHPGNAAFTHGRLRLSRDGAIIFATVDGGIRFYHHNLNSPQFNKLTIAGNPGLLGTPAPQSYGTNWIAHNTLVTNQVGALLETNLTRYRCTGWTGSGSVPQQGTNTSVVFVITNNSTLTWDWTPIKYQSIVTVAGLGNVDITNAWYNPQASATFSATPANGNAFIRWLGDVPASQATNNPLTLTMDQGRRLIALFGQAEGNSTYLQGNWPTFGNGPAHTGYFPGVLGDATFSNRWTVSLEGSLQQVAVADNHIFVTPYQYFGTCYLAALDEASGQLAWRYSFNSAYSVNPPTYNSGSVYVQRGNSSDTHLWSFNATTGTVNWAAPHGAQWERYMAPTVADGKVWVNGGYYGGLYGFNQASGSQLFFQDLDQYHNWTPTYYNGRLFSFVHGTFREHSPSTGSTIWSTDLGWDWHGYDMGRTIAAADGYAYFAGNPNLYAVDLSSRRVAWQVAGSFTGTPTIARGVVYAISGNTVVAFGPDGTLVARYLADSALQTQPIVTDDVVIVSSSSGTYVFDIYNQTLRQKINVGGYLSLANGVLYVATSSGQLCAFSTGQDRQLVITGNPTPYGFPSPQGYGTNFFPRSCFLTNHVSRLVETNMGRFQCQGWTGTGSVPATGTNTTVVVSLETNSTLTWIWAPVEFQLLCQTAGPGRVDMTNSWHTPDTFVTITATPDANYRFIKWLGDVPQDAATNATLTLKMSQGRHLIAVFGAANRGPLAGDWPTFGRGPSHAGYFPGLLGDARFGLRWTSIIGGSLQQAAVGGNRIFVTPSQYFGQAFMATIHEYSGQILWWNNFDSCFSINPPTYDSGSVYVQRGNHSSDTHVWSLDAATGATNWKAPHSAQWEHYMAPLVADGGVWVDGGYGGGLYGFNQTDGSQRFFQDLAQQDGWTPTYYAGKVYTQVGQFREHDPLTGEILWSLDSSTNSGAATTTTLAMADGAAYYVGEPNLFGIDLATHRVSMRVDGNFSGFPAVANRIVYAISNSTVAAYSTQGAFLGSYVAGTALQNQPIVTDDALIVASDSTTYVFDLFTYALKQTIPAGGCLSLADGVLYITGTSGELYAYSAGQDVQLVVNSSTFQQGALFPFLCGTNIISSGTMISPAATPTVTGDGVRYAAAGWTGTGSVPARGTGNVATLIITNNSSITWTWNRQYYFDSETVSNGVLNVSAGWFDEGSHLTITATPADYFYFAGWGGDASGTNNEISLMMDQPRRIIAQFEPYLITNNVPKWWLAQYGLPITDASALADTDGDGVPNWREFLAGSNPNAPEELPRFVTPLLDQYASCGTNVTFAADAAGTPPLSFQWQFKGSDIVDATNSILTLTNVQESDSGIYTLLITSPYGQANSSLNLTVTNDLSWALNTETLMWISGGDASWFGTAEVSYDGTAAARSGQIWNNQNSWMETTVTGPGVICFWWKISSEHGFDYLTLSLDGNLITSICGEIQWEKRSIGIPPGQHTLRWIYEKDGSVSRGQDCAWVDQVSFWSGVLQAPKITRQPSDVVATLSASATFSVQATGTPPLTYQWMRMDSPVDGATNSSFTIETVDESCAGRYSVDVSGPGGSVTSVPVLLTVTNSLTAALGYAGSFWDSGYGDASWFKQSAVTRDQVAAAQSGKIGDNQSSSMRNTVCGPGNLSFWWKVSSEQDYDFLYFNIDGEMQACISGNVGWQQRTFYIPPGVQSDIEWTYVKDSDVSSGLDCGWVDGVRFTPDTPPVIAADPRSQNVFLGSTITLAVSANGTAPFSYTWFLNDMEIDGAHSASLKINNVQWQNAGAYRVRVDNNAGSTFSKIACVTVSPWLPDQIAMQGANVTFDLPGGDARQRHQWYFNSTDNPLKNGGCIHGTTARRLVIEKVQLEHSGLYICDSTAQASLTVLPSSSVVGWGDDPVGGCTAAPVGLTDVIAIAAGRAHNLALKGDGSVIGWGCNDAEQLNFPNDLHNVTAISAGFYHSLLLADGTILPYGDNSQGQLEIPLDSNNTNTIAISAGAYHNLALQQDGTVVAWGSNEYGQSQVPEGLSNVIQIAAGGAHSLALRKDGTVVAWGYDFSGQCSVPSTASKIVAIAAGDGHSLALRRDGVVIAWGENSMGQTQVPNQLKDAASIAAGSTHSLALRRNGTIVAWGGNYSYNDENRFTGAATPPIGLKGVKAIAASANHNLALILAPVITSQPTNLTVAAGESAQFQVEVCGQAPLSFQWRFNNRIIRSATNAVLSLQNVQKKQAGSYSVLIKNSSGSTLSAPAKLIVPSYSPISAVTAGQTHMTIEPTHQQSGTTSPPMPPLP